MLDRAPALLAARSWSVLVPWSKKGCRNRGAQRLRPATVVKAGRVAASRRGRADPGRGWTAVQSAKKNTRYRRAARRPGPSRTDARLMSATTQCASITGLPASSAA